MKADKDYYKNIIKKIIKFYKKNSVNISKLSYFYYGLNFIEEKYLSHCQKNIPLTADEKGRILEINKRFWEGE